MKIDKENLKRYVACGALLSVLSGTSVGLAVNCKKTNHTEEKCAIAKIMDILPPKTYENGDFIIPNSSKHMALEMEKEYTKESDENDDAKELVYIESGRITYPVYFEYRTKTSVRTEKIDDMFDGEYGLTAHFADGSSKSLVLVKDKKHNNK